MAEGGSPGLPQAFTVVDDPRPRAGRWAQPSRWLLASLAGLALLALLAVVVEGLFIYKLHLRMEKCCQTQQGGGGRHGGKHGGSIQALVAGSDPAQTQERPFAHLMSLSTPGSSSPQGEANVVQWVSTGGDAITRHMGYSNGRLLVERSGYYYLYSKVHTNIVACSQLQHKVMKETPAYDNSILLMKSNSFHCVHPKGRQLESQLWDNYLGGIFYLQQGDKVFVTLDNLDRLRPGTTENFMGAYMIWAQPALYLGSRETKNS